MQGFRQAHVNRKHAKVSLHEGSSSVRMSYSDAPAYFAVGMDSRGTSSSDEGAGERR